VCVIISVFAFWDNKNAKTLFLSISSGRQVNQVGTLRGLSPVRKKNNLLNNLNVPTASKKLFLKATMHKK